MVSWAHLNEEGLKQWGDVFPDGKVPIRSIIPSKTTLVNIQPGDGNKEQDVYILNISALTPETFENLVQKIASKFNSPSVEVKKSLTETGTVLRTTLTSGAGTDDLSWFDDDLNDEDEDIGEDDDEEDEDW